MTDGPDGSGQIPRRTTRVGDGGAPVSGALAIILAATVPVLAPTNARAGEGTWQDLVLLYTTDIKGKIEPCG